VSEPPRSKTRADAFVDWTLRWGVWLWAGAILLAVPATWRTASLYAHLRSELEQLLPGTAPSVVALNELRSRMPGLHHLGVVVDSATPEGLPAAEHFLDDLAARIRGYPPELVRTVRTGNDAERRFVEDHAPLYMDVADLETVRSRIEARRDWEASKDTGGLLDEDAPPPSVDLHDIEERYRARARGAARYDDDRFSSKELHLSLLLVQIGASTTGGAHRGEALLGRVKADIASLNPAAYSPALRVGFTGDVAINVEETDALKADLTLSSAVVAVLEVVAILLYYRWWQSLLVLFPPLLLAAVFTFGVASLYPLRVTELNSNTAFLGSIIAGNGINFGIVLLARYVEERRAGLAVRDALVLAVGGARIGTSAAALAAGVSYASLALTDFRGFRQFGLIGGVGMALSWLLAFLLMPPLAAWVDRAPRIAPARHAPMAHVARFVRRHRVAIVAVAGALAAAAAWEVHDFGADRLETDFSKLRRADTWTRGEGYWGRKMDALLGSYLTPTVILTDSLPQARAIGKVLIAEIGHPPLDATVAKVRTIDDALPSRQDEKVVLVEAIRADLTPRILASLDAEQRRDVDRFVGRGPLRPLTVDDVPEAFTVGLRERDGAIGREVLVYPRPTHALWEGPPLAELVRRLRAAAATTALPGERPARVAGSLVLSDDILEAVRRDAALSSLTAFVGVVAAIVVLLRAGRSTGLVLGSLLLGVLWLAGWTTAIGIKINFANFIAYPITFGIGVDYAVNVVSRWEAGGHGPMTEAVRTTGGAVVLCSTTTIIGYSSLLLAENRALFLFGLVAVLGEIACLSTAVVVLPAVVDCFRLRGVGSPVPADS
jgi:predicted RND superfamily exporter protein